ncbi:MAG TPA: sugar phosphate isomerase/epimerase family protein [Candidatus Saccharimonadales bacterium]|jgi:sugar phosphate isomerase/epimerase|nr:sugar phosphate isomerase/epimerase family protein [Candidatus Saccharimonadales bacterium]
MLRALSSYVFIKQRLHPGLLDQMANGGAQAIEIFAAKGHFDYTDKSQVKETANWFKSGTVEFHSMHSPIFTTNDFARSTEPPLNIVDGEKRRRIDAMDEIKRALEVAEHAPFRFLVQHIGNTNESDSPRKFEDALSSIEHLRAFARPLGVTLLLENTPNELSSPVRLMELIKALRYPDLGVCFDAGHAHLDGTVAAAFEKMKDRIRSTHLHDNKKDRDSHLWPGEGGIDWNETMQLLRTAPSAPALLLEIEGEEGIDVSRKMAEAYKKLESAGEG